MLHNEHGPKTKDYSKRKKLIGLIYGLTCGISFAIFAWGIDAAHLAFANATFFWIKFVPGLIICSIVAAGVGWLTIHFEKHSVAFFLWGVLSIILTILVLWLPTSGTRIMLSYLSPDLEQWLKFPKIDGITQIMFFGLIIIGLAAVICGILEINLVEQVMHSSNSSSLITMMIICLIVFGIVGNAVDQLLNVNFREPIQALNATIQTAVDYDGKIVPKEIARARHLSAINYLDIDFNQPRHLTLIAYDPALGNMDILVHLKDIWLKCTTIYSQTSNCVIIPKFSNERN